MTRAAFARWFAASEASNLTTQSNEKQMKRSLASSTSRTWMRSSFNLIARSLRPSLTTIRLKGLVKVLGTALTKEVISNLIHSNKDRRAHL